MPPKGKLSAGASAFQPGKQPPLKRGISTTSSAGSVSLDAIQGVIHIAWAEYHAQQGLQPVAFLSSDNPTEEAPGGGALSPSASMDASDVIEFGVEDTKDILTLSFAEFMSLVAYDKGWKHFLDTFCQFSKRSFDIGKVELDKPFLTLLKNVLLVFLRCVSGEHRRLQDSHRDDAVFGQFLYDNWVLDAAKCFDLASIYGPIHRDAVGTLFQRLCRLQPTYFGDMAEGLPIAAQLLGNIQDKVEELEKSKGSMPPQQYESMCSGLLLNVLDTVASTAQLVLATPDLLLSLFAAEPEGSPANAVLNDGNSLLNTLVDVYEVVLPYLYRGMLPNSRSEQLLTTEGVLKSGSTVPHVVAAAATSCLDIMATFYNHCLFVPLGMRVWAGHYVAKESRLASTMDSKGSESKTSSDGDDEGQGEEGEFSNTVTWRHVSPYTLGYPHPLASGAEAAGQEALANFALEYTTALAQEAANAPSDPSAAASLPRSSMFLADLCVERKLREHFLFLKSSPLVSSGVVSPDQLEHLLSLLKSLEDARQQAEVAATTVGAAGGESEESKVAKVQEVMPHLQPPYIKQALEWCHGDVHATVQALAEGSVPGEDAIEAKLAERKGVSSTAAAGAAGAGAGAGAGVLPRGGPGFARSSSSSSAASLKIKTPKTIGFGLRDDQEMLEVQQALVRLRSFDEYEDDYDDVYDDQGFDVGDDGNDAAELRNLQMPRILRQLSDDGGEEDEDEDVEEELEEKEGEEAKGEEGAGGGRGGRGRGRGRGGSGGRGRGGGGGGGGSSRGRGGGRGGRGGGGGRGRGGRGRGGSSGGSLIQRARKEKNKAKVANHNRKAGAAKKMAKAAGL